MKNIIIKFAYAFFLFVFIGCNGLSDKQVTGRYYLVAMDYVNDEMILSYKLEDGNYIGVVEKTVFAVGFNDNYIIIKQHPSNNRAITNYYIVAIYKENNFSPEKGVIGPLNLEQFKEKRKELGIQNNIAFTKVLKNLE